MLRRQLPRYMMVGVAQLCVDAALFIAMTAAGLHPAIANLLSRLTGAAFGFAANGRFTFESSFGPWDVRRSLPRFASSWVLLTLTGTVAVWAIEAQSSLQWAWIAKPLVDALLAVVGFVLSRHWIYR